MTGNTYSAHGPEREARLGSWRTLSGPDGQLYGGLFLDPATVDGAALARVSQVVQRLATLKLPGLMRFVAQVAGVGDDPRGSADGQPRWLVWRPPGVPTLRQSLAATAQLAPAVAMQIAVETGQELTALHKVGAAHGDVSPDTVVVPAEARALLAECGIAHAVAGTTPGPGHDLSGWLTVLDALIAASEAGPAKELLARARNEGEAHGGGAGLTKALALLTAKPEQVPGYRELAEKTARITPEAAADAAAAGDSPSEATTVRADQLATRLDNPVISAAPPPPVAPPGEPEVLRYGRGVARPPSSPATPQWRTHTMSFPRPQRPGAGRRFWGVLVAVLSTLTTIAILVAIGWILWDRFSGGPPLAVNGATVALAAEPGNCTQEARFIGEVTTNGNAGDISYEWVRSDGHTVGPFERSVPAQATGTQVEMIWPFAEGEGVFEGTLTLRVLSPTPAEASTEITYRCAN